MRERRSREREAVEREREEGRERERLPREAERASERESACARARRGGRERGGGGADCRLKACRLRDSKQASERDGE